MLPEAIEHLKEQLRFMNNRIGSSSISYETKRRQIDNKLRTLRESIATYEHALGLTLVRGDQELLLSMNCIDSQAPERVFMFAVHIGENNLYHVTKVCSIG